ncbi:hypothetical protein SDC9_172059 [bioreactor metagenome]|uniref:Uncharacterized protein n=1 Tax=bioreactor metagenome TaxID=1076179 RepID=A0A645GCM9_9ZZZZ
MIHDGVKGKMGGGEGNGSGRRIIMAVGHRYGVARTIDVPDYDMPGVGKLGRRRGIGDGYRYRCVMIAPVGLLAVYGQCELDKRLIADGGFYVIGQMIFISLADSDFRFVSDDSRNAGQHIRRNGDTALVCAEGQFALFTGLGQLRCRYAESVSVNAGDGGHCKNRRPRTVKNVFCQDSKVCRDAACIHIDTDGQGGF